MQGCLSWVLYDKVAGCTYVCLYRLKSRNIDIKLRLVLVYLPVGSRLNSNKDMDMKKKFPLPLFFLM